MILFHRPSSTRLYLPNEFDAFCLMLLLLCRVPGAELLKLRKGRGGVAGVDCLGAQCDSFFEIASQARGHQNRCGGEYYNIAARAWTAVEHVVKQLFVSGQVAASELIDCGARES